MCAERSELATLIVANLQGMAGHDARRRRQRARAGLLIAAQRSGLAPRALAVLVIALVALLMVALFQAAVAAAVELPVAVAPVWPALAAGIVLLTVLIRAWRRRPRGGAARRRA